MRWSPLISLSLFTVLAITSIFESVFAAPLDVEITARSLKNSKSSATYRKPTLRDIHRTTRISGKIPKKIADFIRPKVQVHRPALSGNTAHASGHVKDYMKQTATASKDTAKKCIDEEWFVRRGMFGAFGGHEDTILMSVHN
ncbi:hypothetical protein M413DRAFT_410605 [Hebeloma cylindrosporum]|uniref:Uncharacterized protein n=1 Tax=Hebeloma cylindrosporum TaxID=76867 RepID=A0A0C2XWG6_HEBCY|nr:hypothetical protein M413DRAFT_410605 [Hebeloma cylindrosporum h7]